MKQATFRFYAELNDFLPKGKRQKDFSYRFNGKPSVKDAIQAIGVPHSEVDLILINGQSVGFRYHLQPGDLVSVYPVFETFDISKVEHLRPRPLRNPRFILDVHLGKLAKYMRLCGFDTLYRNDYDDPEIVNIGAKERRIILTKDVGLLKTDRVTHGYWIRSRQPQEQLKEVLGYFSLYNHANPFSRCTECNGRLKQVYKFTVKKEVTARTYNYYKRFFRCKECAKVYWEGSHYDRMEQFIETVLNNP